MATKFYTHDDVIKADPSRYRQTGPAVMKYIIDGELPSKGIKYVSMIPIEVSLQYLKGPGIVDTWTGFMLEGRHFNDLYRVDIYHEFTGKHGESLFCFNTLAEAIPEAKIRLKRLLKQHKDFIEEHERKLNYRKKQRDRIQKVLDKY